MAGARGTGGNPAARARASARPRAGRRLPAAIGGARLQARLLGRTALGVDAASPAGTLEDVGRHRHALIVTYRRDGTPVATPVWAAVSAGRVYVRSERASGKAKRLRNDPRALIAPCSSRGRPRGPALAVRGRVLDAHEERVAEAALAARYGLLRALFERTMDAMRVDMCYLELAPDVEPASAARVPR